MIERRGRVLSSEFWITVDGEDAVRALDTLPFGAAQDGRATCRHRFDVLRDGQGFRIREDGRVHHHLPDAEAMGRSINERVQTLALAELAMISYNDEREAREAATAIGFPDAELFDNDGSQAYRFRNEHDCVVTCRGTEPDEWNDLRADGLGHRLHGDEQRMSGGARHRREATAGVDVG